MLDDYIQFQSYRYRSYKIQRNIPVWPILYILYVDIIIKVIFDILSSR